MATFMICATDGQSKLAATMRAESEAEALESFRKEWDPKNRLTVTKTIRLGKKPAGDP